MDIHRIAVEDADATGTWASSAFDCTRIVSFSAAFTVEGMTGTSIDLALQISNAVPPNGQLGIPTAGLSGINEGWVPPDDSWITAVSGGADITETVTGDGTTLIAVGPDGLLARWVRAAFQSTAVSTGTVKVEVFGRGCPA